jgi:phage terminase Nu1 subunit (DNA packaging protein)
MEQGEQAWVARYEALNERIAHVKGGADQRAEQLGERIDRLDVKLDARVEKLADQKADQVDLEKVSGTLDKVLLAIIGFSLTIAASAALIVLQVRHP